MFDSPLFRRDEEDIQNHLLVIQCDSGHLNGDLIACARYRVYDERVNAFNRTKIQNRNGVTHVLFIINLPHQVTASSFVGFQGDPWISAHIDDLRPTSSDTIEPLYALASTISDLFIGGYIHDILPLLDTTHEQIPKLISESDSEESLVEEGEPTQEMPLHDAGGEADVEDEGSESEDDTDYEEQQVESELLPAGSSPCADHIVNEQLESLKQLAEFPRQTSESMTYGSQQQQPLQEQEHDQSPTEIATAQIILTDAVEVLNIEEMEFTSSNLPQGSPVIQNMEHTMVSAYQESPEYFEVVDDDRHQDKLSALTLEPAERESPALTSMDESITRSQATVFAKPEVHQISMPADINMEVASKQEVYPPSLSCQNPVKKQPPSGQCRRLYSCIQAAASRLEDSTKDRSTQRVASLTKLIQRYPDHLSN